MASPAAVPPPTPPESDPRLVEAFVPFLEKLVKNASWRNKAHSKLSHTAKSILDRLQNPPPAAAAQAPSTPTCPTTPTSSSSQPGPLRSLSLADSELLLGPITSALGSGSAKLAEAGLELLHRLIAHSYIHGEADPSADPSAQLVASLLDAACNALHLDDEHIELLLLKTLLSAVTSTSVRLHGDCLLRAVRACYDMYLGSRSVVNQATAKASLVQMLVIVFRRMEADSSTVPVQPIVVADVIELPDAASGSSPAADANFVQGFISKIIGDIDGALTPLARTTSSTVAGAGGAAAHDGAFETTAAEEGAHPADLLDSTDKDMLDAKYWEINMYKSALEGRKDELGVEGAVVGTLDDDADMRIGNKLRRDAFLVFRALCKLSMKTPPKDAPADPIVMRGKILALELLKILLENAGAVFRTSERSVFFPATDVVVLKFMVEVCWAPMLAAFSVPLDQSDDEIVISQCLKGFRSAIHVTAAMSMKTQRDAFVTSLAKFTSLHSAADIKQKNVEAIKYTRRYPTNMPCFPIKQARKHRQKEACDTDTNSVLKDAFLTRISGGDDVNRDAQSVPCMIDAKCLTQFFVNVCGNRVSMQEDLNSLTVKQLTKTVCKKAGIQAYDFYAVHGGKSLKDDKTVSCYPIYRDSTVFLRYRLRAGCPRMISFKICTFDEMIKSHEGGLFRRVNLSHRSRSSITNENEVTFLSYFAQYIAHQVLVYVCGKHRKGLSFDGKFESTDIFFCSGRVRFTEHVERVGFTEITCRADYKKLMQIFGKCFTIKTENNMEFILCMFLSCLST